MPDGEYLDWLHRFTDIREKPVGSARSVVLVIGAAGKFAGLVVPALRRRDVAVRALVRDEARAAAARALGATEIAIGDLRDAASLAEATRGVDGVFHIGPAFAADEAAMGVALVEAAQRSGVRKFVFSSVIQPTNIRLANHASKVAVEDALYSSRLEYTICTRLISCRT
ncbi:NmrA family NAD(P)-binding protein [Bordetella bronchiseptica]|uniref:NmrA family NAD(P)-binding protein n=1 Tax=Bordetella bronchiseptica TaxID=518 RepID=UPI001E513CE6|nr:NmrA family NAD(P)-binding protein [Bordetella bronchiseptica]